MASGSIRKIIIKGETDDKDIKRMANSLDSVTKSAKKLETGFSSLRNIAYGAAGASIFGFGVRELTGIADGMTQLNSKLNIFVGEGEKASRAFKDIAQIATDTRAPIADIATIFTRIATATQRLNLSTGLQLGLTRVLQQSFKVSGATAEEATASTIQFAQALSFGQLRGQELRSVLSQNSTLATIFGRAIEGSGKDIYKFAEAGGFTTKFVLKALFENMKKIDDMAQKIAPTFEQTLNLAMNAFTIKVKELNEALDASNNFYKFVNWILENGDKVTAIILSMAAGAIPKLILSVKALTVALLANPIGLIATAFAAGIATITYGTIQLAGGTKQFIAELKTLPAVLSTMVLQLAKVALAVVSLGTSLVIDNPLSRFLDDNIKGLKDFVAEARIAANMKVGPAFGPMEATETEKMKMFLDEANKLKDPLKSLEEQIGAINIALNKSNGKTSAGLISQLEKLENAKLKESLNKGTISLVKFNEELAKNKVEIFALQMEHGILTIEQFNQKINEFKISELSRKFSSAKITLQEYTEQMRRLRIEGMDQEKISTGIAKGTDAYLTSVKSMSEQVGGVVEGAFKGMEDALFNATKSGALNFKDMAQSILDDITRIAIRMSIIQPIAGAMSNFFNPTNAATGSATMGTGIAGATPTMQPFAKGGVLEGPSFFGMGQGKMGVAGEAGPEAVLPLKRSADGVLGVRSSPTIINITNNSGGEVTTQEKTGPDGSKIIDVMIQAKVREGIANGMFDRQMKQSFGLSRKGV